MTKDPMEALQLAVDVAQMKTASVMAPMRPAEGAFFELNRVLYEVTRVSSSGKMLCKPFTGTLAVPRGTATATQIQGAKKA